MSLFTDCEYIVFGYNGLLSGCQCEIYVCCVFQPCAPRHVPMEAPVCAGTSVCVLLAGPEQAATQVYTPAARTRTIMKTAPLLYKQGL